MLDAQSDLKQQPHKMSPSRLSELSASGVATLLFQRSDGYTYYREPESELVFSLPFPSNKALADYYDGFLFQQPSDRSFSTMLGAANAATTAIFNELKDKLPVGSGSILEFGGGLGFYANGFSKHFRRVVMFEVDPKACAYAKNAFDGAFEVYCGKPGEELPFSETFDVVFSSHVIEHYVDLPVFFNVLKRVLRPGGVLIVATPNNASWEHWARPHILFHYLRRAVGRNVWRLPFAFASLLRNSWLYADPPRHLYALNSKSLSCLAASFGFNVTRTISEYTFRSKYALTSDSAAESNAVGLKRFLWSTVNRVAKTLLSMLIIFDKEKKHGGNLVLIAVKDPQND